MENNDLFLADQRTEEVQQIIDRMPNKFGRWVTAIVIFIFLLMGLFGFIVRYPDIVQGQITINADVSPLILIASSPGKIHMIVKESSIEVKEGQIVAYIENPTDPYQVSFVDSLLRTFDPNGNDLEKMKHKLVEHFPLGELNTKYYAFGNALQILLNYKKDRLYDKQGENLVSLQNEQLRAVDNAGEKVLTAKKSLSYMHKFFSRDSTLFAKKVISESELDKTQVSYLNSKDAYQNALSNLISMQQAVQQTRSRIDDLTIQMPEKEKELRINLVSTYNDLADNIKSWEQKYVFRAPFKGLVQYLKFYKENEYISAGEQVCTIVPALKKAFGQVILPSKGSGKLKPGQEVIVKLDGYPYLEYGSISGRVRSMSLTASLIHSEKGDTEAYLVSVDFPRGLKTNFGSTLEFRADLKGTAEIITNDRVLIERLFDNLSYALMNQSKKQKE